MVQRMIGFDELLSEYQARGAQFVGEELERRRNEFDLAFGMNRLEGAGLASSEDNIVAELWISGRITDKEYLELCVLTLQQNPVTLVPRTAG